MPDSDESISWSIEPLGKGHDRKAFSCGKDALDNYLKQGARQDARRRIAAPFVMVDRADGKTIIGYFTLSVFCPLWQRVMI